jgi:hypothetical protein
LLSVASRTLCRRKVIGGRDIHLLDEDGMVACNPRDREAAHRAEMDDIATTTDRATVTCKRCCATIERTRR